MAITINDVNTLQIRNAKNGDFDIALTDSPQAEPEQGVTQIRANVIQIRNAKNGDFDLNLSGANCYNIDDIASGTAPSGVLNLPTCTETGIDALRNISNVTSINAPNLEVLANNSLSNIQSCTEVYLPKLKVSGNGLGNAMSLQSLHLPSIESADGTFINAYRLSDILIGRNIQSITGSFCRNLMLYRSNERWTIRIMGKPDVFTSNFNCNVAGDLYVVWAEGEVAGAPWGLTNATIHYNTVFDDDGNIISSD